MRLITFVYLALVTAVPTALSIPLSGDGMVADLEARGIILDPVMMARVAAQQSAAITTSSPAPTTTRIDPVGPLLLNHPHNPSHRRSPGEEDLLKRDPLFGGFGLGFRPPPPDFTSITIFPDPEPTFTSSTSVPTTTRIDPVGSLPINPNRHHRRAFPHGPLGDGLRDRRGIAPGMLGPGGRLFLSQALGATPSKRSPSDHDYLVKRELEDIVRRLVLNIPHRISVPVNTNIPGALPSPPFTQSAPTPQSSTLDHTPLRQPEFVFADENKTAVKRDVLRLMNRRSPKFVVLPDGFETPVFSMPRVSPPSGFISVPVPKFTPSTSTPTPDLAASTATPTQINPVGGTSMDRIHS